MRNTLALLAIVFTTSACVLEEENPEKCFVLPAQQLTSEPWSNWQQVGGTYTVLLEGRRFSTATFKKVLPGGLESRQLRLCEENS